MRRVLTVLVVTTALVATLASNAMAYMAIPCIIGCYGTNSVGETSLR